jgi:hypothetical protein
MICTAITAQRGTCCMHELLGLQANPRSADATCKPCSESGLRVYMAYWSRRLVGTRVTQFNGCCPFRAKPIYAHSLNIASHIQSSIQSTDASKSYENTVGIGIFIADILQKIERNFEHGLTDNTSVYLAELAAIKQAVEIFSLFFPREKKIYLFSDCRHVSRRRAPPRRKI